METNDGSGFRVVYNGTGNHITDRDGVTHNQNGPYEEDANGNLITQDQISGTWTDSLGRIIPLLNPLYYSQTTDYTGCTGPLPNVSASTWTVPSLNGGTATFKFCYVTVNLQTNFQAANSGEYSGSLKFLQSVVLPNGTTWTFEYNSRSPGDPINVNYGDLTKVTFPTSGTISYGYVNFGGTSGYYTTGTRVLSSRTVNANDGTGGHTWMYQWGSYSNTSLPETNISTDPIGNDTVYTNSNIAGGYGGLWRTITKQVYQGSRTNGTLLQTVATDWKLVPANRLCPFSVGCSPATFPIRITTAWPNGKTSKVEVDYDSGITWTSGEKASYGSVVAKREYDYGSGAPGLLLRTTTTNYQAFSNANYLANNLLNLPSSLQVTDGGGNQAAYTSFAYDEGSLASSGIGLSQQHDTNPPSGTARGNLTSVHQWMSGSVAATPTCSIAVSNSYLVSYRTYYDTGKMYQSTDSCGQSAGDPLHTTTFAYSSTYVGAFPTSVTNQKGQITTYVYDINTGLATSTTDLNGQTKTNTYDNMLRLATVSYPDGGLESHTHQESSFPFTTTVTQKISSTQSKATTYLFDGVGRVSQSQLADPQGTIYTDQGYDGDGREVSFSNPYRSKTTDSTYGVTQYRYDALDRPTLVTKPDGSTIQTAYCASTTLVTDESGRWRRTTTDGLGRAVEVDEPNSTTATVNVCPGTGEPTWVTTYGYDALDDLKTVVQSGSRSRSFNYDSLKHLTNSTNPEAGAATYGYDADGNLLIRTDARGITTTYLYDTLNRLTQKTYSDGTTATAKYGYDAIAPTGCTPPNTGITNGIGRLTTECTVAGSTTKTAAALGYDSMGRVLVNALCTPLNCGTGTFSLGYTYDLAGDTTSYGTGNGAVTFSQSFDSASRATQLTSSAVDAQHPSPLATVDPTMGYYPNGAIRKLTLGNLLTETSAYNNRLQPCRMNVNSSGGYFTHCTDSVPGGNVLDFTYGFNSGTTDNGNVASLSAIGQQTFNRTYAYDQLNRIATLSQTSGSATGCSSVYGLSWTYDAWGNRTDQNVTAGTCNSFHATVGTNNRLGSPYQYDAAGNMTNDGSHSYTYDAENRLSAVDGGSTATYVYDASGLRVEKVVGSTRTDYLYDLSSNVISEVNNVCASICWAVFYARLNGQLVAEYKNLTTYFFHGDHLGSTRLVTGVNQAVVQNLDYLPFGEMISTDSGIATHKFTGKERDSESGLDDFGARYYSSQLGRWMSADWSASPEPVPNANLTNPQTLNLYAMVTDNPESFADLDGHAQSGEQIKGNSGMTVWRVESNLWVVTVNGQTHIVFPYGGTPSVNVAENVIWDNDANGGQGLSNSQKTQFKGMQKETEALYQKVNIYFLVTYTNGSITWGDDAKPVDISGAVSGELNVFVMSGYLPPQFHGAWGVGDGMSTIQQLGKKNYAFSFIGLQNSTPHWILSHEFAHHFLGNTLGGASLGQKVLGEVYINHMVLPHIQSYGGILRGYASSPNFTGICPPN
jgi:RHS repeat-associated protein